MVVTNPIAHSDTAEPVQPHNDHRPHPPRTFMPELIQGAQTKPCTPWKTLPKPPPTGWWAIRQSCNCPPCYFYNLTDQINNNTLPFSVALPLAQLMNVGLMRLNFRHADHVNTFTAEDKNYALSLHRDICYGINSDQLPLQLLEILLTASRKAVLKPLDADDPEYHHKDFELYLKRAIRRCKDKGLRGEDEEQTQEGAHKDDHDNESAIVSSEEVECEGFPEDDSGRETAILWTAPAGKEPHSWKTRQRGNHEITKP